MREEHYNKRHFRTSPGTTKQQRGNGFNTLDRAGLDAPKSSQPSWRSDSDVQGRALTMKRSNESSAYNEEMIHVPSAFDMA